MKHDFIRRYFHVGNDNSEETLENAVDSLDGSSNFDHCIPVTAVKALGCVLSERYPPFKGLFQSVCERHQLCYACVSDRKIVHLLTTKNLSSFSPRELFMV